MKAVRRVWIGADPGGKGKFGIAILKDDEPSQTALTDCADEAVLFIREHLNQAPAGIGVDAPLWWSSGQSSDRLADQWLRRRYSLSGGEVQTANSLTGAALVQAAMFIRRIREVYPGVRVTESHPKALLKSVYGNSWDVFSARFHVNGPRPIEHRRDAVIAAIAAREAFEGRWTHDLSINRLPSEQDPNNYWLAPVHYFWPEE